MLHVWRLLNIKILIVRINVKLCPCKSASGEETYVPYMDLNKTLEYAELDANTEHDIYNALFPTDVFMQHGRPVDPLAQDQEGQALPEDEEGQNETQEIPAAVGAPTSDVPTASEVDLNTSFHPFLHNSSHISFDIDDGHISGLETLEGHDDYFNTSHDDSILHQFDFSDALDETTYWNTPIMHILIYSSNKKQSLNIQGQNSWQFIINVSIMLSNYQVHRIMWT